MKFETTIRKSDLLAVDINMNPIAEALNELIRSIELLREKNIVRQVRVLRSAGYRVEELEVIIRATEPKATEIWRRDEIVIQIEVEEHPIVIPKTRIHGWILEWRQLCRMLLPYRIREYKLDQTWIKY